MKRSLLALSLLAFVASVSADGGTFVGINAGQSTLASSSLASDQGRAFGVFVGHDYDKYAGIVWGAEGAYNSLGNFGGVGGERGYIEEIDATLVGTRYFNDANTLGLYGKVGIDHTWVSGYGQVFDNSGYTYGFGLRYLATQKIEARLGYQYYGIGSASPMFGHESVVNLGAAYHF